MPRTDATLTRDPGRAWGTESLCFLWVQMSACFAYFRETFLYSILLNCRLVWHYIPILFRPIHIYLLEAMDHFSVVLCLVVWPIHRHLSPLTIPQGLKIELTFSHGYQPPYLWSCDHLALIYADLLPDDAPYTTYHHHIVYWFHCISVSCCIPSFLSPYPSHDPLGVWWCSYLLSSCSLLPSTSLSSHLFRIVQCPLTTL